MTTPVRDLRHRLRMLDPGSVRHANWLLSLLHDREAGGGTVTARGGSEADRAAAQAWLLCKQGDTDVGIAPLLAEGRVPTLTTTDGAPDGLALAATLDSLDPLLALVERQHGLPLLPVREAREPPAAATLVLLEWHAETGADPRAASLLATSVARTGPSPRAALGSRGTWLRRHARAPLVLRLCPAPLAPAELARLAEGDLLLLGRAPCSGRLEAAGATHSAELGLDWALSLHAEACTIETRSNCMADTLAGAASDTQASTAPPLALEAVVELGTTSFAEAAGLTPGMVLSVPADGSSLPVRILAGNAPIARGELVAVGDGYGVLVTRILGEDAAPQARG